MGQSSEIMKMKCKQKASLSIFIDNRVYKKKILQHRFYAVMSSKCKQKRKPNDILGKFGILKS